MRLKSTDRRPGPASQAARRRSAILGAVTSTLLRLSETALLIWLRTSLNPAGFLAKLFLIFIVLGLGSVPLIWISLRTRLKEIQGGEEDAAAQY